MPHKLTQHKMLKKTLKQKVTTVMTTKRMRKKEDYGLRKSLNTSEMMLMQHKLTQHKMLKKTLKQKVTTVKTMMKMMKKEMTKKEMTTKRKRKKEDYGLRKSVNTSEMMLMPHKLTQHKMLKKTLKQKVTTVKTMMKMMKKEMT